VKGLPIAALREQQTIDYVLEGVSERRGGWVCTANLDILRQWCGSGEVREIVGSADMVVADGMPLVWASALQGSALPERVAGSSLIVTLSAAAADAEAPIFLLGGNPGTADAAARQLLETNPSLRVVGTLCPPLGFQDDPAWVDRIESALREADPKIVYVALGFPKQESLIIALRARLPELWFIPCGISFSFVAGEFRRAPALVQRLGLEWLHRLVREPRRLHRRYVLHGIPFLVTVLWSALAVRLTAHPELS